MTETQKGSSETENTAPAQPAAAAGKAGSEVVTLDDIRGKVDMVLEHAMPREATALRVEVGSDWEYEQGFYYASYWIGECYPVGRGDARLAFRHPETGEEIAWEDLALEDELMTRVREDEKLDGNKSYMSGYDVEELAAAKYLERDDGSAEEQAYAKVLRKRLVARFDIKRKTREVSKVRLD